MSEHCKELNMCDYDHISNPRTSTQTSAPSVNSSEMVFYPRPLSQKRVHELLLTELLSFFQDNLGVCSELELKRNDNVAAANIFSRESNREKEYSICSNLLTTLNSDLISLTCSSPYFLLSRKSNK